MKSLRVNQKLLKKILIGVVVVGFLYLIFFAKRTEGFAELTPKPYYFDLPTSSTTTSATTIMIPASEFKDYNDTYQLKTIRWFIVDSSDKTKWKQLDQSVYTTRIDNGGTSISLKSGTKNIKKCETHNDYISGGSRLPIDISELKTSGLTISGLSVTNFYQATTQIQHASQMITVNSGGIVTSSSTPATVRMDLVIDTAKVTFGTEDRKGLDEYTKNKVGTNESNTPITNSPVFSKCSYTAPTTTAPA